MSTRQFPGNLPTAPGPTIDPETRPYWDAADQGRLVVPFCTACEEFFWYPRGFCPRCAGSTVEYRDATGGGVIYSYTIVDNAFGPWAERLPFVVAWVTLDEGVTVATNIVEADESDLAVGASVSAVFETTDEGAAPALRFRPA
jgi:uncharacterized OB-fold protein